jgi:hypothetical protein
MSITVTIPAAAVLATYKDANGHEREIVCRQGANGTRLVSDRTTGSHEDERLVAHLEAEEPEQNAMLICDLYLADGYRACRALTQQDLTSTPLDASDPPDELTGEPPVDKQNRMYRLAFVRHEAYGLQLRWHRHTRDRNCPAETVSVRDAMGSLESYEPIRRLTRRAITRDEGRDTQHCAMLRVELRRVEEGQGVLNRRLREAVHVAVATQGLSFSEIAIRCHRVRRGNPRCIKGETTWLRRRIGEVRDQSQAAPTPWVKSDILAMIARDGLGIDPREVEVP